MESSGSTASQRCHTCHVKRLSCDQTLPSCRKCSACGVECPGYGRNLRWVQPTEKGQFSKQLVKRSRGRPKLRFMKTDSGEDSRKLSSMDLAEKGPSQKWPDLLLLRGMSFLQQPLMPEDYRRTEFQLRQLEYHNTYMVKDIGVIETTAKPHNIPLHIWRYIPSYLVNILIAAATTHQIIRAQSKDSFSSSRHAMRTIASHGDNIYRRLQSFAHPKTHIVFNHIQHALGDINAIIAEHPDLVFGKVRGFETGDLVIIAIFALLLSEIQQTAFGPWPAHLEALRVLLKARGGYEAMATEAVPRTLPLLVSYMMIDVFRRPTFTSRSLYEIDDEQFVYLQRLESMFQDGLETGSPCPTKCFQYIIKVNQLRRQWYCAIDKDLEHLRNDSAAALNEVRSFDPIGWAKARKPDYEEMVRQRANTYGSLNMVEKSMQEAPMLDDWINFAVVNQLAAVIYGLRTTVLDHETTDWPSPAWSRAQGLDPLEPVCSICAAAFSSIMVVLRRIRSKADKGHHWPWRFMLWPLFVAGMEVACSGEGFEERGFILDNLYDIGQRQANFSLLDAADFLAGIWKPSGVERGRTWDELVGSIDRRALFFV